MHTKTVRVQKQVDLQENFNIFTDRFLNDLNMRKDKRVSQFPENIAFCKDDISSQSQCLECLMIPIKSQWALGKMTD